MPRRNRRATHTPRPLPADGAVFFGAQEAPGPRWMREEIFVMRYVGAASANKEYVCPACNQRIPRGMAHVVAWPRDAGRRAEDRRHWHRACWERRR